MPSVDLRLHEVEPNWLPAVCACCGEPAEHIRSKTVTWTPWWVLIIFIFTAFIGFFFLVTAQTQVTFSVPFCETHKNHWRWRTRFLAASFLVIAVMIGSGIAIGANHGPREVAGGLFALGFFGMMGWVVLTMVLLRTAIRMTAFFETSLKLSGVSQTFVDAIEERRQEERALRPINQGLLGSRSHSSNGPIRCPACQQKALPRQSHCLHCNARLRDIVSGEESPQIDQPRVTTATPSENAYALAVEPAMDSRHCPNCGVSLSEKAVLCVQCGYDFRLGKVRPTQLE